MTENLMNDVRTVVAALEDKKGTGISVLDISEVSDVADCFVICSGSNRSQIQALSDGVEEALGKKGFMHKGIEGYDTANWILLDYGDIVVHIFDGESRNMYDLERIWGDAGKVKI